MPFPNFHAARIKDPKLFTAIRVLEKLSNGIMILGGLLKSNKTGSSVTQSYRFPKNKFTVSESKKWMTEHDIKWILFEPAVGDKTVQAFDVLLVSKKIQSFSQDEIIALIPPKELAAIKSEDSHPFFTMYSVCHEGESTPIIMDENGNREDAEPITWTKKAVQSIRNIIMKGVKLFKRHNKDSSHTGRRVIGKVIHSFEKEIDGKLHHVFIAYHPKSLKDEIKALDVCSQEAKWNLFREAGKLMAGAIENMTGIALANSEIEKPAFSGAKRLGYVQAFESGGNPEINNSGKEDNMGGETNHNDPNNQGQGNGNTGGNPNNTNQNQNQNQGGNPNTGNQNQGGNFQSQPNPNIGNQSVPNKQRPALSYQELKEEADRMGVFPSQLFTEEQIRKDRQFAKVFNELEILKEEKKKSDDRVIELERSNSLSTAKDRLGNIFKEEKIPPYISDVVLESFEEDKDSISDLSDKGLKGYVEKTTKLVQRTAKKIDPDFDVEKQTGDGKGGKDGDPTKASNNPLLEEDYEP